MSEYDSESKKVFQMENGERLLVQQKEDRSTGRQSRAGERERMGPTKSGQLLLAVC